MQFSVGFCCYEYTQPCKLEVVVTRQLSKLLSESVAIKKHLGLYKVYRSPLQAFYLLRYMHGVQKLFISPKRWLHLCLMAFY